MFMLILLLNHYYTNKQVGKKNIIRPIDPSNFKVIFTLLTKTVVIYMQVFIIEIAKLRL